MRISGKILILSSFSVVLNTFLYSQILNDTFKISEIEIYSTRPLKLSGLTYSKLDSTVLLEKANTSLAVVLSEHTHVFMKTNGRGAMASASFRGTSASHTKVSWNDIELNSPMLGMVDFSLIPMFFIDNVELFHGSSSISKTKGALGGLISLTSDPDWSKNFSGSYLQGLGSFGSYDENLKIDFGNNIIRSQTNTFFSHSDNDYKYLISDIIDSVDLNSGKQYKPAMKNRDAWYTNYGMMQELYFRPTKRDFISFSFWGQKSSRSIPQLSTDESGLNKNVNREENTILRGVVSYKHYAGPNVIKILSGINYMDMGYSLHNVVNDRIITEINSISESTGIFNHVSSGIEINNNTKLEISGGIDIHSVNSLEKIKQHGYNKQRIQSSLSASLIKKWDKKWRSNITVASEMINKYFTPIAYNTGIEYHILPDDKLYLHTSLAGNSKYPSLNDLYFQPGGNTSLKSEQSFNKEFGLNYNGRLKNITFESEITAYSSNVKDWILWLPTFKGYWVPENIRRVKVKGLESSIIVSGNIGEFGYKMNGIYALTHSIKYGDISNPEDDSYGKQLPFIPVHSANCIANLLFKGWTLSYLWNYYSKIYTTTSNTSGILSELPVYFMNQVGLNKHLALKNCSLDLNVKVHNLFNEKYRSVLQRAMPGRNFVVQMKISI